MEEVMNAIRTLDNEIVQVQRQKKLIWIDVDTKQLYILHEDIELLY